MNQVDAIYHVVQSVAWDPDYHRVFICPSCMNAILDDEDQCTQVDFGTLRVLDEKFHTCELASYIDSHEQA